MANDDKPKARNETVDMTARTSGSQTIDQARAGITKRRASLRKEKVKNVTLDNIEASKEITADKILNAREEDEMLRPELESYAKFLDDATGKYNKTQKRRIPPANPVLPKELVLKRKKLKLANATRIFTKLEELSKFGRKKLSADMVETHIAKEKEIIQLEKEIAELEAPKDATTTD